FSGVAQLLGEQVLGTPQSTAASLDASGGRSWLPVAAWSALGIWALLSTPTGRRLWAARIGGSSLPPLLTRIRRAPVIAAGLAVAAASLAA
ncbi:hypothetical protein ACFFLM_23475, partial [Deinococcus oregonensis]